MNEFLIKGTKAIHKRSREDVDNYDSTISSLTC